MSKPITAQLVRELKAHPLKAGFLGTLAVVALWFWAPLVIGLFGNDDEPESRPASPALVHSTVTPTFAPPGSPRPPQQAIAGKTWKQIVDLMVSDPLKQPLEKIAVKRDPFEQPTDPIAGRGDGSTPPFSNGANDQVALANAGETPVTGPALMGTAISDHRRSAVIDGKAIQEGEFIQADDGKKYFVERISARKVTLRTGSEVIELTQDKHEISEDPPSGKVIIRRTAG